MKQSYIKNYFNIYVWQTLSMLLGFASMLVVVPYLSKNSVLYGIYTICMSSQIFLTYADLGFLSAGQKYAAESFARRELSKEIEIIGFTGFILFVFTLCCSFFFLYLSFRPEAMVAKISGAAKRQTASQLFLVLAIFSPTIVLQRMVQMIFNIRLEDYLLQRYFIIGSVIKLLSVLWFFRNDEYNVVGYLSFVQFTNLVVCLIGLFIAKRRYGYNLYLLLKTFRFNSIVFKRIKALAASSLIMTFSWVAYYELDNLSIGKLFGPETVAIYAIGFTLLTFLRNIFSIIFSPFIARFNHFIGEGDIEGLNVFFERIIKLTLPFTAFPILIICEYMHPIIIAWVGSKYESSVQVAQWLILCNIFAFIAYPTGQMLIAKEKTRELYFVAILAPCIYWSGILLTYAQLGVVTFAIFKFIIFLFMALSYAFFAIRILGTSLCKFLKEILLPYIPGILFVSILPMLTKGYLLPCEKSKLGLIFIAIISIALIIGALFISYLQVPLIKQYILLAKRSVFSKKK